MIRKKKEENVNNIPVQFADDEAEAQGEPIEADREAVEVSPAYEIGVVTVDDNMEDEQRNSDDTRNEEKEAEIAEPAELEEASARSAGGSDDVDAHDDIGETDSSSSTDEDNASSEDNKTAAGPMLAELVATRAELRRVETERNDLLERLARRQADFENYRKRVERERGETYQRMVGDVVSKLLPVMDNMRRALQAESMLENSESAEFRHFLRGVELTYKQLNDALEELGVEPVPSVGQPFDPHVHEAVATEHSDEYEPDTVTQELLRGYRLGEKLLRPAMVKVSTRQ